VVDQLYLKEDGEIETPQVGVTKPRISRWQPVAAKVSNTNTEAASKFVADMQHSLLRGTSSNVSPAVTPHIPSQPAVTASALSQKLEQVEAEQKHEESGNRSESSQPSASMVKYNPATGESYTVFSPAQSAEASNIPSQASTPLYGTTALTLEEYQKRQSEMAPVLGILRDFRFEDKYELVINPPIAHVNRRLNRHHPIFIGSYVLNFRITFGENDRSRMRNIAEITNPNELVGMLQMFTNRTQLNVVKQALRSQYGFNAMICQVSDSVLIITVLFQ
jgi:hypothetical protein